MLQLRSTLLGVVYCLMGKGQQAEDYHQVALEIRKTQVGPIMLKVQLNTTTLMLCTVSWA